MGYIRSCSLALGAGGMQMEPVTYAMVDILEGRHALKKGRHGPFLNRK